MSINFVYPDYLWLLILVPLTIALGLYAGRSQAPWRRYTEFVLRSIILSAMIFALAGIQIRWKSDRLTTVFILDVSESIPPDQRELGEALIREAIAKMNQNDQAAIILFGKDALVERLPSHDTNLPGLTSIPIDTRTDIASALQLAQAILPGEGAKRIILLSDGRENMGQAIEQANLAATQGIQLLYTPLSAPQSQVEVLVKDVNAPSEIRVGQDILITAIISSTNTIDAAVRLFEANNLLESKELTLFRGLNEVQFQVSSDASDSTQEQNRFRRFRIQVFPQADTRLQNNEYGAFTIVYGPPRILVIEGTPNEGKNLTTALEAAQMLVTLLSPSNAPTSLPELADYEAVILVNVKANDLPQSMMEALPVFVKNLGHGLLMVGGADAYGAGGYLRTPIEEVLPVDMDVRDRELQANLALVLAVDKSGSMGRCHCDNPDLNQTYTRAEVGQPKVDIAKAAIMRSSTALGKQDYLGVVAFDDRARWAFDIALLPDEVTLENAIGGFQANGQTNLQAGVEAAYQALQDVPAKRKHIILMTDGWVRTGDLTKKAIEMKNQGITMSVIAAGEGSAEYLKALAELGGGRYYPATDILSVPDIFLKETIFSAGQYIIEEQTIALPSDFSPILAGLDATRLPALAGYNGTTPKRTARLDLIAAPRGDPLLATWQYGLGRSAAWTSDFKGQWANEWIAWNEYSRFVAQLVNWLLPSPQSEGLSASIDEIEGQAVLNLQALDATGQPLNFLTGVATFIGPELDITEVPIKQIGAGSYQASMEISTPGVYLVRLGVNHEDQSMGQLTRGMVAPYSPEYNASGVNIPLLTRLAEVTGGSMLTDIAQAFDRTNLPSAEQAREVWAPLLLIAALLFPLDVAVRRLMINHNDIQKARQWLSERISPRQAEIIPDRPRLLGNLFEARKRAHRPTLPPIDSRNLYAGQTAGRMESNQPSQAKPDTQVDESQPRKDQIETPAGDPLTRLREAKRRARKDN